MRYQVLITNEPMQDFTCITSAIDYASRHVYLEWNNGILAIETLENGKPFSYTYGFKEVSITIVKGV